MRAGYESSVLSHRIALLRETYLAASPRPEFVFCYGKGMWPHHEAAFDFAQFDEAMGGEVKIARNGESTFVLSKFYSPSYNRINAAFVDRLCTLLEQPV
ncbi:MAG: hypothetical protein WD333_02825 [Dehalococcoidia bacterium]